MRPIALSVAAVLLLSPALGLAADPAEPTPSPATGATPAATPGQAAAPASPAPPAAAPAPEPTSYAVLKGGWFGSSGDYQGDSFSGAGTWEVAVGMGRTFGVEIASGSMTTEAGGLKVRTIPLLLSLRLAVPISVVSPFAEVGAGVYFNTTTLAGRDASDATLGWHAGLGCDVMLGRLLLGAQARYMGISPTIGTVGELTLDRYELLARAGVRF